MCVVGIMESESIIKLSSKYFQKNYLLQEKQEGS